MSLFRFGRNCIWLFQWNWWSEISAGSFCWWSCWTYSWRLSSYSSIFSVNFVLFNNKNYLFIKKRFFGRLANDNTAYDKETLKAIRENAKGLQNISGERLWVELKRIAEGRNAGPVLKVMLEQDTSQYLGMNLFYRILIHLNFEFKYRYSFKCWFKSNGRSLEEMSSSSSTCSYNTSKTFSEYGWSK